MLVSFRLSYPDRTIWAIWEPHQISRIKLFLNEFAAALDKFDKVIIAKTFVGREKFNNIESLDMNHMVERIGSQKAKYIEDFDLVAEYTYKNSKQGDIVIIFGAGESYKLTQKIIAHMSKEPLVVNRIEDA